MQSFSELPLSAPLLKSIETLGFTTPSPIQAQALPILLGEPTDFIGLAATGTGKTAAFSLPFLEKIDMTKKGVQVLVLCPTRELAMQVSGQISLMGKAKGVKALPVYGGSSFGDQVYGLKQGATVVVGTPGRVIDHMERGTLNLENLITIVLDEADEMISMGFQEDIETILKGSNREQCNIWLFSATMSREIRRIADKYLKDPKQVQVNRTEMLSSTVEQIYYATHEANKPEVLCKLIDMADDFYGVVFCQTKSLVADLSQYLTDRGYRVDCLHGDKDQSARERTMQSFRDRKVTILVCTDVAARGLDVKDITHVINYSLPRELDNYVHRIGRTARSGKSGYAMSLVTPSHRALIGRIENMTKSRMKEGRIPNKKDIAAKKVAKILAGFQGQTSSHAVELMDTSWKETISTLTTEEVAGRFIALMFPEVFADIGKSSVEKTRAAVTTTAVATPSPYPTIESKNEFSDEEPRQQRTPDRRGGGGYGRRDERPHRSSGATERRQSYGGGGARRFEERAPRKEFSRDDRMSDTRPARSEGATKRYVRPPVSARPKKAGTRDSAGGNRPPRRKY